MNIAVLAEAATSDGDNTLLGVMVVLVVLYFVPAIIGVLRGVRNLGSVFVINLFLGWTLIGWVAALAMSVRTVDRS